MNLSATDTSDKIINAQWQGSGYPFNGLNDDRKSQSLDKVVARLAFGLEGR